MPQPIDASTSSKTINLAQRDTITRAETGQKRHTPTSQAKTDETSATVPLNTQLTCGLSVNTWYDGRPLRGLRRTSGRS